MNLSFFLTDAATQATVIMFQESHFLFKVLHIHILCAHKQYNVLIYTSEDSYCCVGQSMGQVGVVTKLTVQGLIQVSVNNKRWVYDPRCLTKASPDLLPSNYGVWDRCVKIFGF